MTLFFTFASADSIINTSLIPRPLRGSGHETTQIQDCSNYSWELLVGAIIINATNKL